MDREEMTERERERARVRWAGAVAEGVDSNNDVWSRCGHVKGLLEVCAVARALGGLVEEDADEAPPAARDGGFHACAVARRVLPERIETPLRQGDRQEGEQHQFLSAVKWPLFLSAISSERPASAPWPPSEVTCRWSTLKMHCSSSRPSSCLVLTQSFAFPADDT